MKKSQATQELVILALKEDLGESLDHKNDLTGQLAKTEQPEHFVEGHILTAEPGVLAGTEPAELAFELVQKNAADIASHKKIELRWLAKDGDEISPAKPVCEIAGSLWLISAAERTALNFLSHLSGVASLTHKFVQATKGKTQIFDTRKTTPGLRALEKAAVRSGGGSSHRMSLQDAILIKDNHLVELDIKSAVQKARASHPEIFIQVECETTAQVEEALAAKADAVLLDNMSPTEIRECVQLVNGQCITEASGGITLETAAEIATTGVDRISVGAITKSAPALDMSLEIGPLITQN